MDLLENRFYAPEAPANEYCLSEGATDVSRVDLPSGTVVLFGASSNVQGSRRNLSRRQGHARTANLALSVREIP
jgi:hypothetical protein